MDPESESLPEKEESRPVRTPRELEILEEQVLAPAAKIYYWTLFRYATAWDLLCLFVGSLCSIAGGSALPLMAVR
jgi:ATP-binding cassette, subfamily B (MDR/TAP), member 1